MQATRAKTVLGLRLRNLHSYFEFVKEEQTQAKSVPFSFLRLR